MAWLGGRVQDALHARDFGGLIGGFFREFYRKNILINWLWY